MLKDIIMARNIVLKLRADKYSQAIIGELTNLAADLETKHADMMALSVKFVASDCKAVCASTQTVLDEMRPLFARAEQTLNGFKRDTKRARSEALGSDAGSEAGLP